MGERSVGYHTHLKKATRERERSSKIVREDAKMERSTAGVTGIRLEGLGLGAGGRSKEAFVELRRTFAAVTVGVEDVDVVEGDIWKTVKDVWMVDRQGRRWALARGTVKRPLRDHVYAFRNASRKQGQTGSFKLRRSSQVGIVSA